MIYLYIQRKQRIRMNKSQNNETNSLLLQTFKPTEISFQKVDKHTGARDWSTNGDQYIVHESLGKYIRPSFVIQH